MFSGDGTFECKDQFLQAGAERVLTKPLKTKVWLKNHVYWRINFRIRFTSTCTICLLLLCGIIVFSDPLRSSELNDTATV